MRRILLGALAAFAMAASDAAGPMEDAKSAHVAGDYESAARFPIPLAKDGDSESQL